MSQRNTILNAIRDKIITNAKAHADRVKIGVLRPELVRVEAPVVSIYPESETARLEDDDATRRTLDVAVAVLIRIDASKTLTQQEQMNALYDEIHALLEQLTVDPSPLGAETFYEDPAGIQWGGYDDGDGIAFVGSRWTIVFNRTLGNP